MKTNRKTITPILMITAILSLCTGCSARNTAQADVPDATENNSNGTIVAEEGNTHNDPAGSTIISVKEAARNAVPVSDADLSEISIETDPYVQLNNNMLSGNFLFPYQKGYLYPSGQDDKDGPYSVIIYEDGQGNCSEQKNLPETVLCALDDAVYYYENGGLHETGSLKCDRDGKTETIIQFQSEYEHSLFFANDIIYYTDDIDDENHKTSVYKTDYKGNQKQLLYEFDVIADQIYIYKNDLWFTFRTSDDDQTGLGRLDLTDHSVMVYKDIDLSETRYITANNGYVYFSSSGLKRLNIQDNSVEKIFHDDVDGINFADSSLFFFTEKVLYRADSGRLKKIMKVKGKTDGFDGICVDGGKIFVETYGGAFYNYISQIDRNGKVVRKIL